MTRFLNKKSPKLFQKLPKTIHTSFDFKIGAFKVAQMVNKIWGNFRTKIYHQENSKLAQTGHTLPITDRLPEAFYIN